MIVLTLRRDSLEPLPERIAHRHWKLSYVAHYVVVGEGKLRHVRLEYRFALKKNNVRKIEEKKNNSGSSVYN